MNKRANIVFVENDPDDFLFLEEAFARVAPAIRLLHAKDGYELFSFLQQMENELPVLILLDSHLTQLSGTYLLHTLNADQRYKGIPKIMYSGSTYQPYIEVCLSSGAVACLQKGSSVQ